MTGPCSQLYTMVHILFCYLDQVCNHPSTKRILHERVTLPSGNEISIVYLKMTGDELHDGDDRGPVDRDGATRTKSPTVQVQFEA